MKQGNDLLLYQQASMIAVFAYAAAVINGLFRLTVLHNPNPDFIVEFDNRYHAVTEIIDGDTIRFLSWLCFLRSDQNRPRTGRLVVLLDRTG